jgi:hypothetical protein
MLKEKNREIPTGIKLQKKRMEKEEYFSHFKNSELLT